MVNRNLGPRLRWIRSIEEKRSLTIGSYLVRSIRWLINCISRPGRAEEKLSLTIGIHVVRGIKWTINYVSRPWTKGFLCSLAGHAVAILILALIVMPDVRKQFQGLMVVSATDNRWPTDNEIDFTVVPAMEAVAAPSEQHLMFDHPSIGGGGDPTADALFDVSPTALPVAIAGTTARTAPTPSRKTVGKRDPLSQLLRTTSRKGVSNIGPLLKSAEEGIIAADSPKGAATGLFSRLPGGNGEQPEGAQWHIWLLDASLSLEEERQYLAPHVLKFYQQTATELNPKNSELIASVVAFAKTAEPIIAKGKVAEIVANAVKLMPMDESGIENVMGAVGSALKLLPARFKGKTSIIIWTDESGDDLELLEDTIALCLKLNVTVHVVGPLSVFGMEPGLQHFRLPNNWDLILPVNRGPDSAFPERVRLPFWYDSTDMPWSSGLPIANSLERESLGGPLRCGLLASTGPYALTRLALATGGTYTVLKRHGDLAPPNFQKLVKYAPDYRSAQEILRDLVRRPLRRAVVESAALTWTQDFWPPQREFALYQFKHYPFRIARQYMEPAQFVLNLSRRLGHDCDQLTNAARMIEQALSLLQAEEVSTAFKDEESPRWRAWYALNLGRLLAHSVRIREFLNSSQPLLDPAEQIKIVNQQFNHALWVESKELTSEEWGKNRAVLARRLLEQVIKEHPDTPWSELARWELDHELGFNGIYDTIPRPQNPVQIPDPTPITLPKL